MDYKLNYMCLKRGVSLILGHGVCLLLAIDANGTDSFINL